jgi:hypothetical protein
MEKEPKKFPERKQDLDHRELDQYMKDKKVRTILTDMIAYLVENRCEDQLDGAIKFLSEYHVQ